MDILGEGYDEQRKRVKKRMVTGVKVIRVKKEIHEGDVVEDGWGCAFDNLGGLRKGGDILSRSLLDGLQWRTLGHKAGGEG